MCLWMNVFCVDECVLFGWMYIHAWMYRSLFEMCNMEQASFCVNEQVSCRLLFGWMYMHFLLGWIFLDKCSSMDECTLPIPRCKSRKEKQCRKDTSRNTLKTHLEIPDLFSRFATRNRPHFRWMCSFWMNVFFVDECVLFRWMCSFWMNAFF